MLYQQIKKYTKRSNFRSTPQKIRGKDQKLDQQIKSLNNRSQVKSIDQMLYQHIKAKVRSKVRSTAQKLDQQIKSKINVSKI